MFLSEMSRLITLKARCSKNHLKAYALECICTGLDPRYQNSVGLGKDLGIYILNDGGGPCIMLLRKTGFERTSKVKNQMVWGRGTPKILKSAFLTSYSGDPLPLGHSISRKLNITYYDCLFYLLLNQKSTQMYL